MKSRLSNQEARALARVVFDGLNRIGFCDEHDPRVQPAMLPVADLFLERWAELLRNDPLSAAGPLASLLSEVYEATIASRVPR